MQLHFWNIGIFVDSLGFFCYSLLQSSAFVLWRRHFEFSLPYLIPAWDIASICQISSSYICRLLIYWISGFWNYARSYKFCPPGQFERKNNALANQRTVIFLLMYMLVLISFLEYSEFHCQIIRWFRFKRHTVIIIFEQPTKLSGLLIASWSGAVILVLLFPDTVEPHLSEPHFTSWLLGMAKTSPTNRKTAGSKLERTS